MDSVALAATIGGSVVGLAGVGATAWSSWLQRASAKEITASQHEHERELARGARFFDRRALAYEEMLRLLSVWAERVHDAQRIMRFAGEVRVRTIGSRQVGTAFAEAVVAIGEFFDQVARVRNIRTHGGGSVGEALEVMQKAGGNVSSTIATLEVRVSSELELL